MSKSAIVPVVIMLLQLMSFIRLFFTYRYGDTRIPSVFIEFNLIAVFNVFVLIAAYFLYFNVENKASIWQIPMAVAALTILALLISYIVMGLSK